MRRPGFRLLGPAGRAILKRGPRFVRSVAVVGRAGETPRQDLEADMATIADYRVVMDGKAVLQRGTGEGVNNLRRDFSLPSNIDPEQPGVLMFRIEVEEADGLRYKLSLNGHDLLTLTHNEERFGTVHEVINTNILRFGENRFAAVADAGEGILKLSDVVVYFQATV
jgi:hypothetical protein